MSSPPLGADGLPPGVELFVPPPIDFDPLEEEDKVLLKHGFPRRPPSSSVEELIQWKNLCSSVGLYVTPSFEAVVKGDSQPKSETKTNWSGARVDASEGYKFFKVEGYWTVSRPHPPNKAWESDKVWLPGRFKAGSWVGIGGHAGSHVVQAGVAHRCTTSYHQDTVYETLAWFEWYPEFQWFVKGFQVASGDLVKVEIEATATNKKSAYFRFFNLSAGTRTGFLYKPTDSEAEAVNGNCAEWIVEGHAGGGRHVAPWCYLFLRLPRFGEEAEEQDRGDDRYKDQGSRRRHFPKDGTEWGSVLSWGSKIFEQRCFGRYSRAEG